MCKRNYRRLEFLFIFFGIFFVQLIRAQSIVVKGRIIDANSGEPISAVKTAIAETLFTTSTNAEGLFLISEERIPLGEQILNISKEGYYSQRIRIAVQKGDTINLDPILLEVDLSEVEKQIGLISLSDAELSQDEGITENISGLLQSSKDVFLNAAAFDFSTTFFRPRGLDGANGMVLINGIEMNKQFSGRPHWAAWGGLNDVQRNRVFAMGLKANQYTFGNVAGTTNIIMRASLFKPGGRFSYATSNRSYTGRAMGSYHSGQSLKGWSFSILASRRFGNEGFVEGTPYEANSFFASVEKRLNARNSLNLSAFYTPIRRGRSTALTREVWKLKGIRYNPNWGLQDDKIRNSSMRITEEPVIMLNHYWDISERTSLNTNIGYQFGKVGNTRLDSGGTRNPLGNYYQRLPSYFLRFESPSSYDFRLAYLAEQELINDGQLDWNSFYEANAKSVDGTAIYSIQEDQVHDTQLSLNTILTANISKNVSLNGRLSYRSLKSENFAELKDLLGANGYLDIDPFGDGSLAANSDLRNIDRIVLEGERYKYNYQLESTVISGFAQTEFKYNKIDFFFGISASHTNYQRIGLYQNGYFPENNRSLGASEEAKFTDYGIKGGFTYKITGRHLVDATTGYFTKSPNMRSTFANLRQNNDLVEGLSSEKIKSLEISYLYKSPIVKARLTGFYTSFEDQTEIGFFFTQNALGNDESNAFVQEIVTGIGKRNAGLEFGIEAQVLPTLKFKAAASFAQNVYTNNPNLYLSGDDFDDPASEEKREGNDLFNQGMRKVHLQNYHTSSGPERAYQVGFEYRSPEFWQVGVTTNYFSNAYIDVSNLRRTKDFYTDRDGLPFNDYNEETARQLLKQEMLPDYFLVNIIGGKSWRVKQYFVGFFAVVNNALNQEYRTGGFEDSRRASYRQQLEERKREHGPLFGNRYFFGNGTTYYLNVYVRF